MASGQKNFIPEGSRVSSDGPFGFDLFYQLILYAMHRSILFFSSNQLCCTVSFVVL